METPKWIGGVSHKAYDIFSVLLFLNLTKTMMLHYIMAAEMRGYFFYKKEKRNPP